MATKFNFDPPTGLRDSSVYETNPSTEAGAREQIQRGMDQLKDHINTNIMDELDKFPNFLKNGGTIEGALILKAMTLGECVAGANGSVEIGGGIIFKWGVDSGTKEITFPKPFPNECFFVNVEGKIQMTSSPAYKTLSGAFDVSKTKFTLVTYGYHQLGSGNNPAADAVYQNTTGAKNFAGQSTWFAIGN